MYEKDGEKYFVVDGHVHYWDASPENQANIHGQQFIDCFYGYHSALSPEEYLWPEKKFQRYSKEDMMHDLFEIGYVDVAIFQPTCLTDFYVDGFNTIEQNAVPKEKYPNKFVMANERGFEATFPGNTEGEDLDELRNIFRRKSFVSRQERLCQALLAEGYTPTQLAKMRLGEPPTSTATEKYLSRREKLGLDVSAAAPLLVDPDGTRIPEDSVVEHLRFARLNRISIEGNAGMCRGLLAARYGIPDPEEEVRA